VLDEEVQLRHDEQNECKVERMDGCMNKLQQFAAHSQMNKGRKEGRKGKAGPPNRAMGPSYRPYWG